MISLVERQAATEKTRLKYRGRQWSWGQNDCIRMARSHLINMGHRPPALPQYRSAIGARRALTKAGFETLEDLFDSLLVRINPAEMLLGDIALTRGTEQFDATWICVGLKLMGWIEGEDETVMIVPHEIKAAWRV